MSNNIPAIEAKAYGGHMVTDDRRHTLFRFETQAAPMVIAVQTADISSLLQSAAMAVSTINERRKLQNGPLNAFKVDWWELSVTDAGDPIFTFRFADTGGTLSFALTKSMLPGLHETIGVVMGEEPKNPTPPSSS